MLPEIDIETCTYFSRFAHLINLEFFDDLFAVLNELVSSGVRDLLTITYYHLASAYHSYSMT